MAVLLVVWHLLGTDERVETYPFLFVLLLNDNDEF